MPGRKHTIIAATICILIVCSAQAKYDITRPFEGSFAGIAFGDKASSAQIVLNLTQIGDMVTGTAKIFQGIVIDTGGFICPGVVAVPDGTFYVSGNVSTGDPNHLAARTSLQASGMPIRIDVDADISRDGRTMELQMRVNIPWPCRSTSIYADLVKKG